MYTYSSTTEFDRDLVLEITEQDGPYRTTEIYSGFACKEQVTQFAEWLKNTWYGYSPVVSVCDMTVYLTRANSCD